MTAASMLEREYSLPFCNRNQMLKVATILNSFFKLIMNREFKKLESMEVAATMDVSEERRQN